MKSLILDIRRKNLLLLIEASKSKTISEIAYAIHTPCSYLSQIICEFVRNDGRKVVLGTRLARKIEIALDKPYGWMDKSHNKNTDAEDELIALYGTMSEKMRESLLQQARMLVKYEKT